MPSSNAWPRSARCCLTATPLQNSLLELYGLVSIIDDFAFGDLKTYRTRFTRLGNDDDFKDLKERLRPICKRTLRKQVLEYVKYTNRHALVQEFVPTPEEQRLYDVVSEYLQQPTLYALPASQRSLMTLILRKLLASSTYAISDTLSGLAFKLETAAAQAEAVDAPPEQLADNWEEIDELADEWEPDEEANGEPERPKYTPEQIAEMRQEMAKLREFHALARSIATNSKGEVLLTALRRGFAAAAEGTAGTRPRRPSSKRPSSSPSPAARRNTFSASWSRPSFAARSWCSTARTPTPSPKKSTRRGSKKHAGTDRVSGSPAADMRAALVDYFRDEAAVMIATEAAAEGINLQFCNLVVNYDLPWNPQRIEQRIGRCHRYGQKFDVVVVNFLNKSNAADQRVYELLDEKFRLFSGVFGASDEVLGAVESGVDFEKRIAAIYQKCRTPEQIQFEFDQLQQELDTEIAAGQRDAREKLLDNFDQEVVEKVRIQSSGLLDRFNERLWLLTRYLLGRLRPIRRRPIQFLPHPQSLPRRDDPSRPVPARQERRRRQHLPRRPSLGPTGLGPGNGPGRPAGGSRLRLFRQRQEHRRVDSLCRTGRMAHLLPAGDSSVGGRGRPNSVGLHRQTGTVGRNGLSSVIRSAGGLSRFSSDENGTVPFCLRQPNRPNGHARFVDRRCGPPSGGIA